MNRKILAIITFQAIIIVLLFWGTVFLGKDEYERYSSEQDDKVDTQNFVTHKEGATYVSLNPKIQAQSDIRTEVLKNESKTEMINAYGSIGSIENLIELRIKYLSAISEENVIAASLKNYQMDYQRLKQLNQDNQNISDRVLEASESALKTNQEKLNASETLATNLKDAIRQTWGDDLMSMAIKQTPDPVLRSLLDYKSVIIKVTIPFDVTLDKSTKFIYVTPTASHDKSVRASYLSISPQSDVSLQGKSFFYVAPSEDLRVGTQINVSIPRNKIFSGVYIPANAVIWFSGKAWVYKKIGEDKFIRVPVNTENTFKDGWLEDKNLKPDDIIVTNGAQLLLSEEFKYQIKNENED